jgi:hypothetical protein
MDALQGPEKKPFDWPLDIVSALNLQSQDVALIAWESYKTSSGPQTVYLPISVLPDTLGQQSGLPILTVLPSRDIDEIYLTVRSLDNSLNPSGTLLRDKPLSRGSQLAGQPIHLHLSDLRISTAGFYSVKIGAIIHNGAPYVLPQIVVHYSTP